MNALNTFLVLPFAIFMYKFDLFASRIGCSFLVTGENSRKLCVKEQLTVIKITHFFIVGSILLCFPQNEKAFLAGMFLVGVLANCISSTNLTGRARNFLQS